MIEGYRATGTGWQSRMNLDFIGERAGARTRDLLIKSQLLYQLSYALALLGGGTP